MSVLKYDVLAVFLILFSSKATLACSPSPFRSHIELGTISHVEPKHDEEARRQSEIKVDLANQDDQTHSSSPSPPAPLTESLPQVDPKMKADEFYQLNSENVVLKQPGDVQKTILYFLTNSGLASFANTCVRANVLVNNRTFRKELTRLRNELEKTRQIELLKTSTDDAVWMGTLYYLQGFLSTDQKVIDPLIYQLHHEKNEWRRTQAAQFLGLNPGYPEEIKQQKIKALTQALQDKSPQVRSEATEALKRQIPRDPEIVKQENIDSLTSADDTVWNTAFNGLWVYMHDRRIIDLFIYHLHHGINGNRRMSAARFLSCAHGVPDDLKKLKIKALTQALEDESLEVRKMATGCLEAFFPRDPEIIKQENIAALNSPDNKVWEGAIYQLQHYIYSDQTVVDLVIHHLHNGSNENRRALAAYFLGLNPGNSEAINKSKFEALTQALKSSDKAVRLRAREGLERIRKQYDSLDYDKERNSGLGSN